MDDGPDSRVSFHDLAPRQESFAEAVAAGLARHRKSISPRFLYDEAGAALFGRITELEEYYPTRTEVGILTAHAAEIAAVLGPDAELIEFGASSSSKARILLRALERPAAYVPIDVSADHLRQAARDIAADFPRLKVVAVCADYTQPFDLPEELLAAARRVGFFPGSTIGNLQPGEAVDFLSLWASQLGPGGGMIVGVDLKKDPQLLHNAYNDARGVTAAFSTNLLARANRELDADFDLSAFRHDARYNPEQGRIEINVRSLRDQTVRVSGRAFRFAAGEPLHTEYSYKYTVEEFAALARRSGFESRRVWTDPQQLFSVHWLAIAG
ncbi:MAG TPA: L-histidine N(alpha)-methyltransferase [Caulobacteraceae bacterium]|jgi:dimethylhistidine N-methyltransferase